MARPNCISAFPFLDAKLVGEALWWLFLDETKNLSIPNCFWKKPSITGKKKQQKPTNEFCAVACDRCDLYTWFLCGKSGNFVSPSFRCVYLKSSGLRNFIRCLERTFNIRNSSTLWTVTLKGGSTKIGNLIHRNMAEGPSLRNSSTQKKHRDPEEFCTPENSPTFLSYRSLSQKKRYPQTTICWMAVPNDERYISVGPC